MCQYLYNVEFAIENVDIYMYPPSLENGEDLQTLVCFKMQPEICLEITEDELIDAVNCNKQIVKNSMFSLPHSQLECDPKACILGYKVKCQNEIVLVGCYKFQNFQCYFKELKEQYDCQKSKNKIRCVKANSPCSKIIKELAPFTNKNNKSSGTVHYILRLTCFGPTLNQAKNIDGDGDSFSFSSETDKEKDCLGLNWPKKVNNDETSLNFDEYSAKINGNSLVIRVNNESKYQVTRLFENSDSDVNDCNQKEKCSCDFLTEFQRKTSCDGSTYKNSQHLPIIRGTLKYPGQMEEQTVQFEMKENSESKGRSQKPKNESSRGVCVQVDDENLQREKSGKCKVPIGIKMCKFGCDDDSDVFQLKIGSKKKSKNGKRNEIELEMRTPRGPTVDIPKMETREIQVNENEFIIDGKKSLKKENNPVVGKGKLAKEKVSVVKNSKRK